MARPCSRTPASSALKASSLREGTRPTVPAGRPTGSSRRTRPRLRPSAMPSGLIGGSRWICLADFFSTWFGSLARNASAASWAYRIGIAQPPARRIPTILTGRFAFGSSYQISCDGHSKGNPGLGPEFLTCTLGVALFWRLPCRGGRVASLFRCLVRGAGRAAFAALAAARSSRRRGTAAGPGRAGRAHLASRSCGAWIGGRRPLGLIGGCRRAAFAAGAAASSRLLLRECRRREQRHRERRP